MSPDPARLAAARSVLDDLGVSVADLKQTEDTKSGMPTFAEYLPRVMDTASARTRAHYGTYWNRILDAFGPLHLDQVHATDIAALMHRVQATALRRRNHRDGRGAADHLLLALRRVYRCAVADGLITREDDPSRRVPRPRRLPSTRRALTSTQLAQIHQAVLAGGRDVALDALLLRLHLETACRRGGALGLRLGDLDLDLCLVLLREKGGTHRWQPVSPTLATALWRHAHTRGATRPEDPLLRTRRHRPISRSHYDALWKRIRTALPWAAKQEISTHWLRHTTLTWVERHYGYGVARDFAGHTDRQGASTTTYIRATIEETATALTAMTGEPHPLAQR
jgi:integrase